MRDLAVEFKQVDFGYGDLKVLELIDLEIEDREFLAVIGPNGGGKSTLLKLILGLEQPQQGTVTVFGQAPAKARAQIGYVPQQTSLPKDFPISVEDVVLMGGMSTKSFGPFSTSHERAAAVRAMEAVQILELRRRTMDRLSGGQRQRVLIARALVSSPRLLLLDEPTASVDNRVEQDIFELLKKINQETTIVLVTHDLGFISHYVSRIACLNRQLVCHHAGEVTHEIIHRMYGADVKMVDHQCEI